MCVCVEEGGWGGGGLKEGVGLIIKLSQVGLIAEVSIPEQGSF